MKIYVNGEEQQVPEGQSVAELLASLNRNPNYLAVERNKVLIPRTRHAECMLEADDQIEIVTLVGGG